MVPQPNGTFSSVEYQQDKPIGHGAFGIVWAVTDPRNGERVALKKMPQIFQNLITAKRTFRELRMLCSFRHENVLSARDVLLPCSREAFDELYVLTPLMQSDLHKIIVSNQILSMDHVKVFTYQILRGLKYLHGASILHRDLKPGNLLVNSNCLLKICDFGLARSIEYNPSVTMTQEVVTQYYRPPELLMGVKHYGAEIDIWSVGCILYELLTRKIAFQANNATDQLKLIYGLLGTPNICDLRGAQGAIDFVISLSSKSKNVKNSICEMISDPSAAQLVTNLLQWKPNKRFTTMEALQSPFLNDGRLRFHSCMCTCCKYINGKKIFTFDLEPIPIISYNDRFESSLKNTEQAKDSLLQFIHSSPCGSQVPLCINPRSPSFREFLQSGVAHSKQLPPTPPPWE